MNGAPRTFISWSHADYRAAGAPFMLVERLRRQPLDVWWYLNSWDEPLGAGTNLMDGLRRELERCSLFIGLVTERTAENRYTALEADWALRRLERDSGFKPIFVVVGGEILERMSCDPRVAVPYRRLLDPREHSAVPLFIHLSPDAPSDAVIESVVRDICRSASVEYSPSFAGEDPDLPVLRRTFDEARQAPVHDERRLSELMDSLFVSPGPSLQSAYETRDYARVVAIITALEMKYESALRRQPYYLNVVRAIVELERGVQTQRAVAAASRIVDRLRGDPRRDYLVSSLEGHLALLCGANRLAKECYVQASAEHLASRGQPAVTELFNLTLCELASSAELDAAVVARRVAGLREACGNAPADYERHQTLILCLGILFPDCFPVERHLLADISLSGDLLFATFGYLGRAAHVDSRSIALMVAAAERYVEQGGDASPFVSAVAFDDHLYITSLHDGYAVALAEAATFSRLLALESIGQLEIRFGRVWSAERRFRALWNQYPNGVGYVAKALQCAALRSREAAKTEAGGLVGWILTLPETQVFPPMSGSNVAYFKGFVCWLAGEQRYARQLLEYVDLGDSSVDFAHYETMVTPALV